MLVTQTDVKLNNVIFVYIVFQANMAVSVSRLGVHSADGGCASVPPSPPLYT